MNIDSRYSVGHCSSWLGAESVLRLADQDNAEWDQVVNYGMSVLDEPPSASRASIEIAKAYANGERLDRMVESLGRLTIGSFEADMHAYLASELRRIAKKRKVDPSELCDVSGRTLRDWAARSSASDGRQNSAKE